MSEPLNSAEARLLAADIRHVREDMSRMTRSIEAISDSLQVLARLEQGHSAILERIAENSKRTADHELRIQAIERELPGLREMRTWVIRGVLGGIGMMGLALANLVLAK